jgi:collagen beta-1,O-galactosyltransferase
MRDFPLGHGLVRPGYSHGSFGYMLSRAGIEKVLSIRFENQLLPVDELLPALYIFHPRPDVRRRYPPSLNAFALERDIVTHIHIDGEDDSDTETTGFLDR